MDSYPVRRGGRKGFPMDLALVTSGGDAPGMNAAIRAFVRQGLLGQHRIWGILRGLEGIVRAVRQELKTESVADIIMTGGTMLHTSRFVDFHNAATQETAVKQLREWSLDGLAVLGGNGSLRAAHAMSQAGFPVVGIPSSIDNDIYGTDDSIGYDTAVNNITQSIDKMRDTASSHERIFVVEVMGNRSGALAIGSGLAAGAEAIVVPERPVNAELIADRLRTTHARGKKHSFIVVAEGAARAERLANELSMMTGFEVRWVVLGHTQRGGPPSAKDRWLGSLLGSAAISFLENGSHGLMVGVRSGAVCGLSLEEVARNEKPPQFSWLELAEQLAL